jgi:ABC-type multidrug transport system fused ATPase/permease subunit
MEQYVECLKLQARENDCTMSPQSFPHPDFAGSDNDGIHICATDSGGSYACFHQLLELKRIWLLIVAGYAAAFIGKSIFSAFYTHQLDRFVTMVRGCLVHVIYNQIFKLDMNEADGGESLTLMSADVERVVKGFGFLHDAISNAIMIIISLGLLYIQLGLA